MPFNTKKKHEYLTIWCALNFMLYKIRQVRSGLQIIPRQSNRHNRMRLRNASNVGVVMTRRWSHPFSGRHQGPATDYRSPFL